MASGRDSLEVPHFRGGFHVGVSSLGLKLLLVEGW